MAFCSSCGKKIEEKATSCAACGAAVKPIKRDSKLLGTMVMSTVNKDALPQQPTKKVEAPNAAENMRAEARLHTPQRTMAFGSPFAKTPSAEIPAVKGPAPNNTQLGPGMAAPKVSPGAEPAAVRRNPARPDGTLLGGVVPIEKPQAPAKQVKAKTVVDDFGADFKTEVMPQTAPSVKETGAKLAEAAFSDDAPKKPMAYNLPPDGSTLEPMTHPSAGITDVAISIGQELRESIAPMIDGIRQRKRGFGVLFGLFGFLMLACPALAVFAGVQIYQRIKGDDVRKLHVEVLRLHGVVSLGSLREQCAKNPSAETKGIFHEKATKVSPQKLCSLSQEDVQALAVPDAKAELLSDTAQSEEASKLDLDPAQCIRVGTSKIQGIGCLTAAGFRWLELAGL